MELSNPDENSDIRKHTSQIYINAKSLALLQGFLLFKIGIDILSRALDQVPSALVGLTSLFGMGRGDPHRNRRHKGI